MRNAVGALFTVNKVPAYNIGGNGELATSSPENSSDDAACTADCRLFHTCGAATENDRSPRVDGSEG